MQYLMMPFVDKVLEFHLYLFHAQGLIAANIVVQLDFHIDLLVL